MKTKAALVFSIVAGIAFIFGSLPAAGSGSSSHPASTVGYPERSILIVSEPIGASCFSEGCDSEGVSAGALTTSPQVSHVDVTLTATLDLRTSSGDWGLVGAEMLLDNSYIHMKPGTFRVASPSNTVPTTTTLTWVAPRVPARGRTYFFFLDVSAKDGNRDGRSRMIGRRVAIVAEQTAT